MIKGKIKDCDLVKTIFSMYIIYEIIAFGIKGKLHQ